MQNNFFSLFGLPATFAIDKDALRSQFLVLQKQHHPDNHTGDTRHQAEQNTALINHAYATLNRDDSRAVYLLEHVGAAFNPDDSICDEPFLMQMMAHRMALEDAIFEHDHAQLNAIAQSISQEQATNAQAFCIAFNNRAWQDAQAIAQKMKFLGKLSDDVHGALAQAIAHSRQVNDDDLYV